MRDPKTLLLAAIRVIDSDLQRLEKEAEGLSEKDSLKLCRYTQVLHRCLKDEGFDAQDEILEMSQDKLDAMIDELVDMRLRQKRRKKKASADVVM